MVHLPLSFFKMEGDTIFGLPPKNADRIPLQNHPAPHVLRMLPPERMFRKYRHDMTIDRGLIVSLKIGETILGFLAGWGRTQYQLRFTKMALHYSKLQLKIKCQQKLFSNLKNNPKAPTDMIYEKLFLQTFWTSDG